MAGMSGQKQFACQLKWTAIKADFAEFVVCANTQKKLNCAIVIMQALQPIQLTCVRLSLRAKGQTTQI